MKKRMISAVMAAVLALTMAGCGGSDVRKESEKKMSYEDASSELSSLMKKVNVKTVQNPKLDIYMSETSKAEALDDISTFPITVK